MLDYIGGKNGSGGLTPHFVESTISVNNARKLILQLSRPLADIAQLINDNILGIDRQQQQLSRTDISICELKKKLYIPQTNVRIKMLDYPMTVCAGPKCIKQVFVRIEYKTKQKV